MYVVVHKKLRGGGYHAVHKWLAKHYGKADRCEAAFCSKKSQTYHWAKLIDCEYEHKRENFIRMCVSCHRKYDMTDEQVAKMANSLAKRTDTKVCRNGHPRTEKNTYWAKRRIVTSPVCRDCHNESQRRYVCKSQV
jgi:hypothetical protein